jgi:serine/threonine kinase PknH
MTMTTQRPADWYPDPTGQPGQKYWDGTAWHSEAPTSAPGPVGQSYVHPPVAEPPRQPRQVLVPALVLAIVVLAGAVCVTGYLLLHNSRQSPGHVASSAPLVQEGALEGLLLQPHQLDLILGTSGMTASVPTLTRLSDASAQVSDGACLHLANGAVKSVYPASGVKAVRTQGFRDSNFRRTAAQAVVLLSSAHDASAFYSASVQRWRGCSDRQFSINGTSVNTGLISDTNGVLSGTVQWQASNGVQRCQRALTTASNVVIDVEACAMDTPDLNAGVVIAQDIAANVPKA